MVDREADQIIHVPVHGYEVVAYSFGFGEEVLFCLNGGPGLGCDYIRDSHSRLAGDRYRVVAFDQLGCGASDRPDDGSLWTLERYVEEIEIVRTTLGLGKVHLLGHSWGTWLGLEYALTYPDGFKTLVLADGAANVPHLVTELERLRGALGSETVAMMQRHEAEDTLEHPEYKGALDVLYYRHVCRLQAWPEALLRSVASFNVAPYKAIQGRNEFCYSGSIKDWNRLDRLHRIGQPTLLLCGLHDIGTPACSRLMHEALPNSQIVVLPNSSHMPFFEEPDAYFTAVQTFLDAHIG
ncbi:proline iminopeptidase-family hydrolase [Mesorhizobium sp. WSM3859]|uniref:proline iminopeptidase-family hydrolase n=1 Tax=Mesorhizobium sp. WSM3859 TaxID=2029402 RepID=UPI000BAF2D0C|nr:proline iminopeptidase-family hydrolase [Mesorhizobium sp. WSM3859]PBC09482.1 proline iminopeptidase [Mesorhizobium sp. WSM3859]